MVCYIPGTGTLAVIGFAIYLIWHKTIGHFLHVIGAAMEFTLVTGAAVAAFALVTWTARAIRRRRAAAGACTACRFRCQQALLARPHPLVNIVDRRLPAANPVSRAALTCHPAAPILRRAQVAPRHAAAPAPALFQRAIARSRAAAAPAPALFQRAIAGRRAVAAAPAAAPALFERVIVPRRAPVRPAPLVPVKPAPAVPVLSAPVPAPPAAVRGEPASAAGPVHAIHHEPATAQTRRRVLPLPPPVVLHRPRATPMPPAGPAGPAAPAGPAGVDESAGADESVAFDGYVLTPEGVDVGPEPAQASDSTRANASM
jgi:hypothetical protein